MNTSPDSPSDAAAGPLSDAWPARVANARLHFVTGKGGTGKSTIAAALALALAAGGRKVLLVDYHNMMINPVKGHADLRNFISAFLNGWSETEWEILNLASSGNTVFAERVDRTKVGGKPVSLPCCGVFEMENGQIKIWRDYFDMGTYTKALA